MIHDSDTIEEEERNHGLWCAAHQDRCETMMLGEMLEPQYPRIQFSVSSSMCEGREAWLHFHAYPLASVEPVNKVVRQLVEQQFEEHETA